MAPRASSWVLAMAFALAASTFVAGYIFGRAARHDAFVQCVDSVDQDIDSLKDLASELQRVRQEGV